MIKIKSPDKVSKQLDNLAKKVEAIGGDNQIPLNELLTTSFISKHTRFSTVDEMFDESCFNIENQEDFDKVPQEKLDEIISLNSSFSSWSEMISEAANEWVAKKISF